MNIWFIYSYIYSYIYSEKTDGVYLKLSALIAFTRYMLIIFQDMKLQAP